MPVAMPVGVKSQPNDDLLESHVATRARVARVADRLRINREAAAAGIAVIKRMARSWPPSFALRNSEVHVSEGGR
jgi:hypothetical protein